LNQFSRLRHKILSMAKTGLVY